MTAHDRERWSLRGGAGPSRSNGPDYPTDASATDADDDLGGWSDDDLDALVAQAVDHVPPGAWVEATTTTLDGTDWTVHVASDDLPSAVARAKAALREVER